MTTIERSPTRFFSYLFYLVLLIALSVAIYFFIAQQFLQPAPEVPSEVVFETPAPSPLIVSPADVQFAESFDQDLKAWQLSPAGQAAFDRGALVLDDNRYNDFGWARPHLTFDNFVLEVYARWLGGAIGGGYGVEFRVDDESGDFYAFYLHNDGRFTAGKRLDGTWFAVVDEFSPGRPARRRPQPDSHRGARRAAALFRQRHLPGRYPQPGAHQGGYPPGGPQN